MRFKWLSGDTQWREYGGKWISNRLNNGEFDHYMVIELRNWEDILGTTQKNTYLVGLSVVAPNQLLLKERDKAYYFWFGTEPKNNAITDELDVEIAHEFGARVMIQEWEGNNSRLLIREAKKKAREVEAMFGFYMDKKVNAIGTTGWEALQGDILAGLRGADHDG